MMKLQIKSNCLFPVLVLFCVLSGCSSGGDSENELSMNDACSIVGAKIADGQRCSDSNSSTSSLIRLSFIDGSSVGTCTGTAIGKRSVLTAAHCFVESFDYILVETENATQESSRYAIADLDIVGNRHKNVLYNDVAIVFVAKDLGVPIIPILSSRTVTEGEEVVIAGFGEEFDGGATGDLIAGKALISDVTANHLFITYRSGQSHPCRGDSGGPMLVQVNGTWAIAGTTSQSDPSVSADNICNEGDVTLYTNLQKGDIASFLSAQVPDIQYE